ncbi:hypothetical protein BH23PSE1_BH23PSE1_01830 [soil metagenome]
MMGWDMMGGGMMGGGMMGGMATGALLFWLLANAVLWIVPLYYLLPRAGMNRNLAFLGAVPFLGVILLWVAALKHWPGDEARA